MFRTILTGCLALGILFSAQGIKAQDLKVATQAQLLKQLFSVDDEELNRALAGLAFHQGQDSVTVAQFVAELKSRIRPWVQKKAESEGQVSVVEWGTANLIQLRGLKTVTVRDTVQVVMDATLQARVDSLEAVLEAR